MSLNIISIFNQDANKLNNLYINNKAGPKLKDLNIPVFPLQSKNALNIKGDTNTNIGREILEGIDKVDIIEHANATYNSIMSNGENYYGIIFMIHAIHVYFSIKEIMIACNKSMKLGGLLYILDYDAIAENIVIYELLRIENIYNISNSKDDAHTRMANTYYSSKSIIDFLNRYGFEVYKMQTSNDLYTIFAIKVSNIDNDIVEPNSCNSFYRVINNNILSWTRPKSIVLPDKIQRLLQSMTSNVDIMDLMDIEYYPSN